MLTIIIWKVLQFFFSAYDITCSKSFQWNACKVTALHPSGSTLSPRLKCMHVAAYIVHFVLYYEGISSPFYTQGGECSTYKHECQYLHKQAKSLRCDAEPWRYWTRHTLSQEPEVSCLPTHQDVVTVLGRRTHNVHCLHLKNEKEKTKKIISFAAVLYYNGGYCSYVVTY